MYQFESNFSNSFLLVFIKSYSPALQKIQGAISLSQTEPRSFMENVLYDYRVFYRWIAVNTAKYLAVPKSILILLPLLRSTLVTRVWLSKKKVKINAES